MKINVVKRVVMNVDDNGVDGGPIRCETSQNFRIGPVLHVSAGLKFCNVLGVARLFHQVNSVPGCAWNGRFLLSDLAISTKFGVMLDEVLTKRNDEKNSVLNGSFSPQRQLCRFFGRLRTPVQQLITWKLKETQYWFYLGSIDHFHDNLTFNYSKAVSLIVNALLSDKDPYPL